MSYKVIIDSCGELTEEMKKSGHFETASLQILLWMMIPLIRQIF